MFFAAIGGYNKNGKPIVAVSDVDSVYSLPKVTKNNNKKDIASMSNRDSYY